MDLSEQSPKYILRLVLRRAIHGILNLPRPITLSASVDQRRNHYNKSQYFYFSVHDIPFFYYLNP